MEERIPLAVSWEKNEDCYTSLSQKCVWCPYTTNSGFYTLHKTHHFVKSFIRTSFSILKWNQFTHKALLKRLIPIANTQIIDCPESTCPNPYPFTSTSLPHPHQSSLQTTSARSNPFQNPNEPKNQKKNGEALTVFNASDFADSTLLRRILPGEPDGSARACFGRRLRHQVLPFPLLRLPHITRLPARVQASRWPQHRLATLRPVLVRRVGPLLPLRRTYVNNIFNLNLIIISNCNLKNYVRIRKWLKKMLLLFLRKLLMDREKFSVNLVNIFHLLIFYEIIVELHLTKFWIWYPICPFRIWRVYWCCFDCGFRWLGPWFDCCRG